VRARFAIPLGIALAYGCGRDRARIVPFDCTLGAEHRIALVDGPEVDDVALAEAEGRLWALWSERAGTFARAIATDGAPEGEPIRIGARCEGGIAAAEDRATIWIACGRRGDDARDDEGGVQLLTFHDAQVEAHGAYGALGPDGRGVALAVDRRGTLVLGWQRARGAVRESWIQRVGEHPPPPERVSTPPFLASAPALAFSNQSLWVAWSESWFDARGNPEGRIQLRVGHAAPRAIANLRFDSAMPVLRAGPGGHWLLTFRDRRRIGERPRAYIAAIDGEAFERGRVERVRFERSLPANARGEALALGCAGDVFVVSPRTRSRSERLIAIRRYASSLRGLGPEHQVYEHGASFEHADARCVGTRLLVLVGAQRSRVQGASVRTTSLECGTRSALEPADQRTSRPATKR